MPLDEAIAQNPFLAHLLSDTLFYQLSAEYRAGNDLLLRSGYNGEVIWAVARLGADRLGLIAIAYAEIGAGPAPTMDSSVVGDGVFQLTYNGMHLISQHALLIEGAKQSLAESTLSRFKEFEMGNADLSVWVNFDVLPWVMPLLSSQHGAAWHDQLANWNGLGSFSALVDNEGINLYGQVLGANATSFFGHGNYGKPIPLTVVNILSDKVSFFEAHGGYSAENRLRAIMLDTSRATEVDSLQKAMGLDLLGQLAPTLGGEWVIGAANTFNHHIGNELTLFASVADETNLHRLLSAIDTTAWQTEADSFVVRRLPNGDFLPFLFGNKASLLSTPYWSIHQGYLIIANTEATLRKWWMDKKRGNLFVNSPDYGLTGEWMAQPASYLFYVHPARSFALPGDLLDGPAREFYTRMASPVKNTAFFSFRLVKQEQGFFSHICLHTSGSGYQSPSNQPISRSFDGTLLEGPFLVSNHHTGEKEVLLAAKDMVHVINQSNESVWTYKLGTPLRGMPIEVDLYRNKKIQYLLSTTTHLHLVDRTGSAVSGYPMALPKPLVAEVSMIDLEESGGQQLFVPCGKTGIYGYSAKGIPLVGWNPMVLKAQARTPMQYFVKNGNTYLFLSDNQGNVYVWLTNGKKAVEPIACQVPFVSAFTIQFGAQLSDCKLLGLDSMGNFVAVGLHGSVKKTPIGTAFNAPAGAWVQFDGEGGKELMIWQGSLLAVYDQGLGLLLKLPLNEPISTAQWLISSKGKPYLAIYTTANELLVFDTKGQQMGTAPIQSSTQRAALYNWDRAETDELLSIDQTQLLIYKDIENGSD